MLLRTIIFICLISQSITRSSIAQETVANSGLREKSVQIIQFIRESEHRNALSLLGQIVDAGIGSYQEQREGFPAATGAVSRTLRQLDADEQYELLYKWTMPSDGRDNIRLLSVPVPQSSSPKVFARELGERPRDETFQVSQIYGIKGFFSTGWTLAEAANELGRLSRLIEEVKTLAETNVESAAELLIMLQLFDTRPPVEELSAKLKELSSSYSIKEAEKQPANVSLNDAAIALAALKHEQLRPDAEAVLKAMSTTLNRQKESDLRRIIRYLHASAVQLTRGVSGAEILYNNQLKYWSPVSGTTAYHSVNAAIPAMWLTHEHHILHLTGTSNDVLFFKYPLTGDFEFTCESQEGGDIGTDGGLVYNGLQFEALGRVDYVNIWDADLKFQIQRPNHFTRNEKSPTFNRISIRSKEDEFHFMANLHPIFRQKSQARPSPWLGLRSFAFRRPMFRNFKITGKPMIPRSVNMLVGETLQGWQTDFFNETQPPFEGERGSDYDWDLIDKQLQAPKREQGGGPSTQSLIHYQRPLLNEDTVTYEFFHQPGEYEVHPAFGRLAFLLEPRGIRVHWITDGPLEWTGLKQDNAALEPLNRRGPRPFPLKEADWNKLSMTRKDGKLLISLNEELVYERDIDFEGDEQFGLFRYRTESAVKVRNAQMTGNWPEALPEELYDVWAGFTALQEESP